MDFESKYYNRYEFNEDDDDEEDDEVEEKETISSDEEETGKQFETYLKSKKLMPGAKLKPSKKELAYDFEKEMNNELDNLIDLEHQAYLNELKSQPGCADNSAQTSTLSKNKSKQALVEEEEDTDSEAEMETGVRTFKKRPHFTNDELFYDPEMDDKDEMWLNEQRKTCKKIISPIKKTNVNREADMIPKSILKPTSSDIKSDTLGKSTSFQEEPASQSVQISYTDAKTDAILNCPCCMSMLTMDCQRHDEYKTQYRAMFVFNCKIKQDEILKYPLQSEPKSLKEKKKFRNKKQKLVKEHLPSEQNDDQTMATTSEGEKFDIYKAVQCEICATEVGVYDEKEEMYHFFNILASHS